VQEANFAQAMEQVQEIHFINPVVDAGAVHPLKPNVCLLTGPHSAILPVLLL
jgi:hypothetical protein